MEKSAPRIKRAPVKWFGGKSLMKKKLLPLIPVTKIYVEAYGGAGNLLLARERSDIEVYNDLNKKLVNLMRALQDPDRALLMRERLLYTLYSKEEFRRAIEIMREKDPDPDDLAWAFYVGQNQGFGGITPTTVGNWGRKFTGKMTSWLSAIDLIPEWHRRLLQVYIDSRDAVDLIKYWDSPGTTFYLDPPYVSGTRRDAKVYEIEASDDHHARLVETILQCQGAVVLSGYAHEIYKPLEAAGWERREFHTTCAAAGRTRTSGLQGAGAAKAKQPRVEVVWRNPKAVALTGAQEEAA